MKLNNIYNEDCLEYIQTLENESIDCVLTDPPYLYLKHKLDRPFDEDLLFSELNRVLKKDSMLAIFGRGESLFRWCNKLANLGFKFKEELVWDKIQAGSPLLSLGRLHELCIVFSKGKAKINRVRIKYVEAVANNPKKLNSDLKNLKNTIKNSKKLAEVEALCEGDITFEVEKKYKNVATYQESKTKTMIRYLSPINEIENGVKEKSILQVATERQNYIHPTQKPVRLLERILALISKEGDLVLDTFAGSGSTAVACINTKRNFITCELDNEYYELAKKRINNTIKPLF